MSVTIGSLTESHQQFQRWTEDSWWPLLVGGAAVVLLLSTFLMFLSNPFYVHKDSALFQHAGWYITDGASLYVDIWDLKPPLIYALTVLLAVLSGGNMAVLHILSITVSVGAVIGGIVFLGLTIHRMTDDGFASLVGAFSMFGLTSVYTFPFAGIRPKYFAFLCATAALFLAVDNRFLASGMLGAATAGFWQLGAGIAILVVGMALQRGGPRAAARTIAGGAVVTVLTVMPFVLTGTFTALVVEVVIAPLYGVEQYSTIGRLLDVVVGVGYAVLLLPVAAYGWWRGLREEWETYWWVAVGGSGYLLQIFLEFQGAIELILVFVFVALGIGLLVATTPSPPDRSVVASAVFFVVVLTAYWQLGPVTPVKAQTADLQERYEVPDYDDIPADLEDVPSMQTIYWEKLRPDTCHYRLGHKQKYFEMATGGTLDKQKCGQWPFDNRPW